MLSQMVTTLSVTEHVWKQELQASVVQFLEKSMEQGNGTVGFGMFHDVPRPRYQRVSSYLLTRVTINSAHNSSRRGRHS